MRFRLIGFLTLAGVTSITLFAADGSADDQPPVTVSTPAPEFTPLTSSQRFDNYLGGLASVESVLRSAAAAGIHQAEGSPQEWGQGAQGYGERFGSSFAQHVINRTVRYSISAALHEDNRYFASSQTGFFRRTRYAIKSTFLARHDNGNQYFSFSHIGGDAGAAFISRIWQPPSTGSAADGAKSFGVTIASDVGFNVFREFWPDLKSHLHRSHR
jgi:hypothetical protein